MFSYTYLYNICIYIHIVFSLMTGMYMYIYIHTYIHIIYNIYIYIYIYNHWRILWSSYRKLAWVGFEPTVTADFCPDALTNWVIRPSSVPTFYFNQRFQIFSLYTYIYKYEKKPTKLFKLQIFLFFSEALSIYISINWPKFTTGQNSILNKKIRK